MLSAHAKYIPPSTLRLIPADEEHHIETTFTQPACACQGVYVKSCTKVGIDTVEVIQIKKCGLVPFGCRVGFFLTRG